LLYMMDKADYKVLEMFKKSPHKRLRMVMNRHKELYHLLQSITPHKKTVETDDATYTDVSNVKDAYTVEKSAAPALYVDTEARTDREQKVEYEFSEEGNLNMLRQSALRDYGVMQHLINFHLNLDKLKPDNKFHYKVYSNCLLLRQKTKWEVFVLGHPLAYLFLYVDPHFDRLARLTIYVAGILGQLFISGLFHNTEGAQEDEEEANFWETLGEFSWYDFWVSVISATLVLPFFCIMNRFFRTAKIKSSMPDFEKSKLAKRNKVRKVVAYAVAWTFIAITSYVVTIFAIQFNSKANFHWLFSFATASLYDILAQSNFGVAWLIFKNCRLRIKFDKQLRG